MDKELKESPTLQETIIDTLKSHLSGYGHCIAALFATQKLKDAIQAQQKIWKDNIVLGNWRPLRQTVQARYFLSIENKQSP